MSTRHLIPWRLVYVEKQDSKRNALIREKNLKKADRSRITALIFSSKNRVQDFFSQDEKG
jgi:predicted GIY-YIG superfamily endonuclease